MRRLCSWLFAAALSASAACAPADPGTSRRQVIGGIETEAGMFPATGALMSSFDGEPEPGCTGTLIAPQVVLTAAHCVDPMFVGDGLPGFTLALDANLAPADEIVAGAASYQHPEFDVEADTGEGLGRWYDIGLLMLAEPIDTVPVEILPTPEEIESLVAGAPTSIVGYGLVSNTNFDFGVKHHGTADMVEVGEFELLIAEPGQQQNCNGDSGGPAFVDLGNGPRLVGTVSRSPDTNLVCDHGGVDTRVDVYLDWIHSLAEVSCGGLAGPCGDCPDGDCGGGGCNAAGGAPPMGSLLIVAGLLVVLGRHRHS